MTQDTRPTSPRPSSQPTGLQQEAVLAPESAWIFAWLKSAMLYLGAVTAYLGAAIGLVAFWKKYVAESGEKADITIYLIAGVLALPMLLALLFNLLPALRRRRERELQPALDPSQKVAASYFMTGPRESDPHGFFASGYEDFLEWARQPAAPLLYLTGVSGSGKSSLIAAYLRPHLAENICDAKTMLLTVRSYHDPLISLKQTLLSNLWKKLPKNYDAISPYQALERAAHQLGSDKRLIIVFDQFEEYFLLRAGLKAESDKDHSSTAQALPQLVDADIEPLHRFLQSFLLNPPARVTLMLSYREDHHRLLAPLGLPARQERQNWMTVVPLDFSAASIFLDRCPGLKVPEERMKRVLIEAARLEGGRVVMRPIVANLLGIVLRQMSGHPTLWRRTDDLLRGYVEDCAGQELKEERATLLRALLTDFHTTQPKSIAEVSIKTSLPQGTLVEHLEHLGRAGLVRCANSQENNISQQVWQISHDFIATLIERFLDGLNRSCWHKLRPWLAPFTTLLILLLFQFLPWIQKHRAIEQLTNAGFTWNEESAAIVNANVREDFTNLAPIANALQRLKPRTLKLRYCEALQNLDDLKSLTTLQSLYISNCPALKNADHFKGLTSLQSLDLISCEALQNVDALKTLTALQNLHLGNCRNLQNVNGLKGLPSLQSLDLSDCHSLKNVDGLTGLYKLQKLDLRKCHSLKNLDGLKGHSALQSLLISYCYELKNLDSLRGLTGLQRLELIYCPKLQNLDLLRGLTSLQSLCLADCDMLQNVDGIKELSTLKELDLRLCTKLPKENWPSLFAALPKTGIRLPDGTVVGPKREFTFYAPKIIHQNPPTHHENRMNLRFDE